MSTYLQWGGIVLQGALLAHAAYVVWLTRKRWAKRWAELLMLERAYRRALVYEGREEIAQEIEDGRYCPPASHDCGACNCDELAERIRGNGRAQ